MIDYGTYIRYPSRVHLGTRVVINSRCRIYPSRLVDGAVIRLGDDVVLAPEVTIFGAGQDAHSHDLGDVAAPVTIGDGAYIGGRSIIRYGVTIGPGAVIGAGSVVVSDVPAHAIAAGVPARVIGERAT